MNCVIGKSQILFLLRNRNYIIGKPSVLCLPRNAYSIIGTALLENLRFYSYCVIGKPKVLFLPIAIGIRNSYFIIGTALLNLPLSYLFLTSLTITILKTSKTLVACNLRPKDLRNASCLREAFRLRRKALEILIQRHNLSYRFVQIRDWNTLLLHAVTVTNGYAIVF